MKTDTPAGGRVRSALTWIITRTEPIPHDGVEM
jgi:hypothetical protein